MNSRFIRNVLIKGLILFLLFDLAFAALDPAALGKASLYNHIFSGRKRFPFGEDSSKSYSLSLYNLDAMFASHVISKEPKPTDEYRVFILGDSSIWGTLLHPEETLANQLDAAELIHCGKKARVFNLGYPTISLAKDLMLLDYAMRYKPDLIIWSVTLEAFPVDKQLSSPIVSNNAARVDDLIARYNLPLESHNSTLVYPGFWDATLIGQRRALADLFRLQVYGLLWTATGIDQYYPTEYQSSKIDFNTDVAFHDLQPPLLDETRLAFGVLEAGLRLVGKIPMIVINEPILISVGKNSDLRYNFFYPRWAYNQWRELMSAHAVAGGWNYLDLWNSVPADQFSNSAIHLTPEGESILAGRVEKAILNQSCP
jgi:hypothetical protein